MDRHGGKHRRAGHAFVRQSQAAGPGIGINRDLPPEEQARQIRELFQQLGLGYSCLALYLSSRIDLLPAEFCREFALTPDASPALPVGEAQRILEGELGPSLNVLGEFNPVPIHSTLLTHSYAARLASGVPVVMTFLRPECSALGIGLEPPPSFDKVLVRDCFSGIVSDDVLLDFFAGLRRKCDFTARREVLELMAYDSAGCEALCSPRIYRELCTTRILTSEQVEGVPIHDAPHHHACNTDVLTRNLCQAWLHQVLRGSAFAVDPQPQGITVAENAVLFTGCDFVTLASSTKENLWNYLMATMVDDPDKAAMYLLREMWPGQRAKVDAETFRSKFRQSAYFGALEPLLGTNSNALAQLVFQHWKTALEYDYTPKPHLLCFYRGLFSIARIAHSLSPFADPLREGMEEVRGNRIMGQVKEIVDWNYWLQHSDKFASAMVNLPKMLDDALTRAAAPNPASPAVEGGRGSKRTGRMADMTMIFVLVAVLVFQSSRMSPTMERFVLLLVFLAGLMALRKFTD